MSNSDVEDLVIQIRDHYVAQFRDFVLQERKTCGTGGPEVKFELPEETSAFYRLVVVDFVRNDAGAEAILFEPENVLTFDRIEGNIGETELSIDGLRWDAVIIHHDVLHIENSIEDWFIKWFDPDEVRFDHQSELSNCIHSLYVAADELIVDLGTAPPEAFWELLESLADGNATSVNVCS